MLPILAVIGETIALAGVVSATILAVLLFRNPYRAEWLRAPGVDNAATMLIVTALAFTTGFEISGLVAAGVGVIPAMVITGVIIFGTGFATIWFFNVGERLRRADAGQSPFLTVLPPATAPRRGARKHA